VRPYVIKGENLICMSVRMGTSVLLKSHCTALNLQFTRRVPLVPQHQCHGFTCRRPSSECIPLHRCHTVPFCKLFIGLGSDSYPLCTRGSFPVGKAAGA
jgi:hypothetical protein